MYEGRDTLKVWNRLEANICCLDAARSNFALCLFSPSLHLKVTHSLIVAL